MIPLRDNIPASRPPVVTYAIVAICSVVWLVQLGRPDLIERLGMVPTRVLGREAPPIGFFESLRGARPLEEALVPEWLTLLTCTFLHGGWFHFLGNMLFLWIFGDNVEDRLGRPGFVLFYLGCGVAASAAHLVISPESSVPTIGASGAIAGVMGGYMLLYPHARVQVLIFFFFIVDVIALPAVFFLGFWFVLQFLQGTATLGTRGQGGGVAFWAHIGGFVAGVAAVYALKIAGWLRPARPAIQLTRRRPVRPPYGRRGLF